MTENYQTVSQLLAKIKIRVESEFSVIKIQGEITNWSKAHSGHYYFSLNDDSNSLNCALFKMDARFNKDLLRIKDGEKVFVEGNATVYTKRSSVQVVVRKITLQNKQGDLKIQFEKVKKKLALEGLFDLEKKKTIPKNPKKIALITSPHGAAVQDFLKIMMKKSFSFYVVVIPTLVQGKGSEKSLVEALKKAINLKGVELIVFTRGGGSLEDLWSFNDELLAREIYKCPIPTISAVGHEINYSISDFVADARYETPTAAAEDLSSAQFYLISQFEYLKSRLRIRTGALKEMVENKVRLLNPRYFMSLLERSFQGFKQRLKNYNIKALSGKIDVREKEYFLDEVFNRSYLAAGALINRLDKRLSIQEGVLQSLDPKRVLKRGYSYISEKNDKVYTSKSDFEKSKDTVYYINFHDGKSRIRKQT